MKLLRQIKKAIIRPRSILIYLHKHLSFMFKDDKKYLSVRWKLCMGYEMDWNTPRTYNEKQQWLKIYDRRPEYTLMVDKYLVKSYVAGIIGEEYIIPTIGVWDSADDVDFEALPNRFALKCNHNSGTGMFICKDKTKMDIRKVRNNLRKGLKENYFLSNREWPYKNVPRKIIAEQFMEDHKTGELRDYKFFCFDGVVRGLFIATGRSKGEHFVCFDFFDADFNHLPVRHGHPNAKVMPEKPETFEEMKRIASTLSKGIPSVRIDLYEINGKVYFGEMTFTHWGGFMKFDPPEWDAKFGEWIKLPTKNVKTDC